MNTTTTDELLMQLIATGNKTNELLQKLVDASDNVDLALQVLSDKLGELQSIEETSDSILSNVNTIANLIDGTISNKLDSLQEIGSLVENIEFEVKGISRELEWNTNATFANMVVDGLERIES